MQIDFSSLIDVRIVKHGKLNSAERGTDGVVGGTGGVVEVAAGHQNAKSSDSTDNIGEATPGPTKGIYPLHSVDLYSIKTQTHLHFLMCSLHRCFSKWKGRRVGRNQRGFECKEGTVVSARQLDDETKFGQKFLVVQGLERKCFRSNNGPFESSKWGVNIINFPLLVSVNFHELVKLPYVMISFSVSY